MLYSVQQFFLHTKSYLGISKHYVHAVLAGINWIEPSARPVMLDDALSVNNGETIAIFSMQNKSLWRELGQILRRGLIRDLTICTQIFKWF